MSRINRTSNSKGIKGSVSIQPKTIHPNKDYTVDEQLLLLYLLSLPPEWNLKQNWVIKQYNGTMGRDRVTKAWSSLKTKGHLVKKRGTKFTDVYWLVYELPIVDSIPVDSIPVDCKTVDNNNNNKESNNKENNITGTSILGKKELEQNPIENLLEIENIRDDNGLILLQATELGADIFRYDEESKFFSLEKRIGSKLFKEIIPALRDWIWAKNILNNLTSTTRRG